jgi:hypothetical protein
VFLGYFSRLSANPLSALLAAEGVSRQTRAAFEKLPCSTTVLKISIAARRFVED